MTWLLKRLKEPSTWRGIIFIVTISGINFTPEQTESIITAGVALIGVIEVFRKEEKPPPAQEPLPWLNDKQPTRKE